MDITIRHFEKEDIESFKKMLEQPSCYSETLQLPFLSIEKVEKRFSSSIEGVYSLVAVLDGQMVGHSGVITETIPRRKHVASIGLIVHDEFRGKGVGNKLMESMIELATNWLAIKRLELEVYTDNEAAVSLYKKFGFVIEGTAKAFAFRRGEYADVYRMARVDI